MKQFNQSQLKTVVDICIAVGTVIFGSVAIPIAFNSGSVGFLLFGIVVSFWFWYSALVVSKSIK